MTIGVRSHKRSIFVFNERVNFDFRQKFVFVYSFEAHRNESECKLKLIVQLDVEAAFEQMNEFLCRCASDH